MLKVGHYYEDGQSCFRVYAPHKRTVAVQFENSGKEIPLVREDGGFWFASCGALPEGTLYWLCLDGDKSYPDPASRAQPFSVHGASMIVNPKKPDLSGWKGVGIEDAVIYELHLGTFTTRGNLSAATEKLPHLADLGITVVELMPINEFPGNCDWGYDGVYQYALESSYGSYDDLKTFIETAHQNGIAVILDVVYNHFGPEGNYSGCFAAYTRDSDTPWGSAINFDSKDCEGIRNFYLGNVEWWIGELGFDGFRLDAWAMIEDSSEKRIHREIVDLAHSIGEKEGRKVLMIAEHLRNNKLVTSLAPEGDACDSQWVDDFGQAIRSCIAPDKNDRFLKSFYGFDDVLKALDKPFILDGTRFNYVTEGYTGTDFEGLSPKEAVVYLQDHDQVGNRPMGDRFAATSGLGKTMLAATTLFASKFVPMIFMGEEYGETSPFLFFESFTDPWLIEAVREGRSREFQFSKIEPRDPHDIETFGDSRLDWELMEDPEHAKVLAVYKSLISLKKAKVIGCAGDDGRYEVTTASGNAIIIDNGKSLVLLNMSESDVSFDKVSGYSLAVNTDDESKMFELKPFSAQVLVRG